jgi:hypothetical protein
MTPVARAETIGRNQAEVPDMVGRGQLAKQPYGEKQPDGRPLPLATVVITTAAAAAARATRGGFESRWRMTRGFWRYAETLKLI